TNKDLAREVEAGRFREDLYYRLSTVLIRIPPLRERAEDILPIFESFVHQLAQKYGTSRRQLDDAARALLRSYRWPGNVRELRNVAEQVVVLHRSDTVTADDVRPFLRGVTASGGPTSALMPVAREGGPVDEARERELIYRALLELRLEMRDLKEQVAKLTGSIGIAVPRRVVEEGGFGGDHGDLVIVSQADRAGAEDYASFIEDVVYEIENGDDGGATGAAAPGANGNAPARAEAGPPALPTLEEAEHDLITRALKHFDGNRRQTARALGISERTLYRKLKDLDEDL
ncbi:MAG: helix-turn-helix domain-containing protein, partial [Rhodothermales bacterium]|nr:helix-turn-helix domain-containing protein [Rhodothermales bacterium]